MLGILVEPHKALGLAVGLAAESCIRVHLSAAGLLRMKIQLDTQSLQKFDNRASCLWKESVVVTRDKK